MPADFGVMALLTFFTSLAIVFVQGGLSAALIQQKNVSHEEESAVFWWNLAASCVFGLILMAIAPVVANFYDLPVLRALMPVAAVQIILSALGAVQSALLTKTLRFDQLTIAGVISSLISGAIGVAAALSGAGVWALAMQLVSVAAVNSIVLWVISPWRPSWHYQPSTLKSLFQFGIYLSLSSLLEVTNSQGFALLIGKLHGIRDLGLFNRANGTQQFPSGIVAAVIGRIALPLFSLKADDVGALRRGLRMGNRLSMLINLPAMIGLAVLADLVVVVLFGEKWRPAGWILTILAIGNILAPFHVLNLQLLLAQGRSDRFFKLEIVKKVLAFACIVVGSFFGIAGLAYAVVVMSVLAFVINAHYSRISIGYGAFSQIVDVVGAIFATMVMAGVLLAVKPLINGSLFTQLMTLVALGSIIYIAAVILLMRYFWTDVYILAADLVRRPSVPGSST